jgi:hypothetical protein
MPGFGERQSTFEVGKTRRIVGRSLPEIGAQLRVLRPQIPHHRRHLRHQFKHLDLVRRGQWRRPQITGCLDRITGLDRRCCGSCSSRWRGRGNGGWGGGWLGRLPQRGQNGHGCIVRRFDDGRFRWSDSW